MDTEFVTETERKRLKQLRKVEDIVGEIRCNIATGGTCSPIRSGLIKIRNYLLGEFPAQGQNIDAMRSALAFIRNEVQEYRRLKRNKKKAINLDVDMLFFIVDNALSAKPKFLSPVDEKKGDH